MDPIYAVNGTFETFRPMSYTSWRAENIPVTDNQSADRTLAIIGEAEGGRPGQQYPITSIQAAEAIFRSGPLLEGIRMAMLTGDAPFGRIRAVNVRPGTRSSVVLQDAADKVFGTIFRNAFRERANQASLSLSGSAALGYTVALRDADTGLSLSTNNLGLGLRLQYQGVGSSATANIVVENGIKVFKTTTNSGSLSENLTIPLTSGTSLRDLCERINRSGPYNAYPARDGNLDASTLDVTPAPVNIVQYSLIGTVEAAPAGATSVTLGAPVTLASGSTLRLRSTTGVWFVANVTAAVNASDTVPVGNLPLAIGAGVAFDGVSRPASVLTALVGDFALFFSTRGDAAFTFTAGASDAGAPVAQANYFAGGSSDVTTFADWMGGLDTLADKPVGIIVPLTDNQAIVAGFRSHVSTLNSADSARFVQLIAGYDTSRLPSDSASEADVDEYVREVGSEASAANSRDMVLVGSTQDFMTGSGLRARASLPLMAAHIAGLAASVGPDASLTYTRTGGTGAFPRLTRSQTNQLTRAGVICLEPVSDDGTARIVRDRTTYVGASNAVYESGFGVRKMNAIARGAKAVQDRNVPGGNGSTRLAKYRSELEDYYERLVERGWIEAGISEGKRVNAYDIAVSPTGAGGRLIRTRTRVNVVLEFLVGDQEIVATTAEFEI